MTTFSPDPKPAARIVDPMAIRRFRHNAAPVCQLCGRTFPRHWLTVHHIVERSVGGDDVEANFALVCGDGTLECHGAITERRPGARHRLRKTLSEDQVAYVTAKKGEAWLDRHYPLSVVSARSPAEEAA